MKAVMQRVKHAVVHVDRRIAGKIDHGILVFLGVHVNDTQKDVAWMAKKLVHLRIFEDDGGLMNRSLLDVHGEILIVSQFTLLGNCRRGRRPSWSAAAPPRQAKSLYLDLVEAVNRYGVHTATGEFQAMMEVTLINNGPVTLLLDSRDKT